MHEDISDLSLNFALCIRKNKNTDKNYSDFKQTSMTEHFPNSLFHGKDHYKDFRDICEPVFLKEIKERSRKLRVDTHTHRRVSLKETYGKLYFSFP